MAKKKNMTQEEIFKQTLITEDEYPYKVMDNWLWVKLGYTATIKRGASPRPIKAFITSEKDGVNWIKIGDTGLDKFVYSAKEKITTEGAKKSVYVEKGTLVLSNSMSFGRPYILALDGCIHDGWLAIKVSELYHKEYMYYALLASKWYFEQVAVGTAVRNLNAQRVSGLPVPLPPLAEQQRIVNRIESLIERIDKAQQMIKEARDGFEKRKEAILAKAFRGELTARWREENGLKMSDWETGPIKEYTTKLNQGWSPKCESFPSVNVNEWGVIKTTAIQHMTFDESENKQLPKSLEPKEQHELKSGDILITRAGPRVRVGVCCLVKDIRPKLLLCDKAYRFNAIEDKILPEYLVMLMNSPDKLHEINRMKTGISDSGVNITQKGFLGIEIQVPSIVEQQKIVDILNKLIENEIKISESSDIIDSIKLLKKSILAKAFRGELGTNDPNEESSLELLKEILNENHEGLKK